jgi:hypothetical protein
MNKKVIIALVLVLAVLALFATMPLWRGRVEQKLIQPKSPPIVLNSFGPDADRFSINGGGQKLTFEKKDGAWQVNGTPAKEEAIKALLASLKDTTIGELVAKNPANHAALGVTEQDGYSLHVEQGSAKLDLIIGPLAPDGLTYYVRSPAANEVYSARGPLRQQVIEPESVWQSTPLAPVPPATKAPVKKKVVPST